MPEGQTKYSRRNLLDRSVVVGAGLVAGPTLFLGSRAMLGNALAADASTVRVLTWEGYAAPKAYGPLTAKGVKIDPIAMNDDNVDPINKAGQYDIGTTTVGIFPNFIEAGLAQPLDHVQDPELKQHLKSSALYSSSVGPPAPEVKNGVAYGVPFAWGTARRLVSGREGSVRAGEAGRPSRSGVEGHLGIVSDPINVIQAVARSLGLGGTDTLGNKHAPLFLTESELEQVFKKLAKFKAQARTIYPSYGALVTAYARGEIIAAMPDWAPDAVAATKGGIKVAVTFPSDCSQSYVDSFFISSKVKATPQMYAFLNQALSPATQLAVGKALGIAVTNGAAMAKLAKLGPQWSVYKEANAVFRRAPYIVKSPGQVEQGRDDREDAVSVGAVHVVLISANLSAAVDEP